MIERYLSESLFLIGFPFWKLCFVPRGKHNPWSDHSDSYQRGANSFPGSVWIYTVAVLLLGAARALIPNEGIMMIQRWGSTAICCLSTLISNNLFGFGGRGRRRLRTIGQGESLLHHRSPGLSAERIKSGLNWRV
jgi:hypothetical protein